MAMTAWWVDGAMGRIGRRSDSASTSIKGQLGLLTIKSNLLLGLDKADHGKNNSSQFHPETFLWGPRVCFPFCLCRRAAQCGTQTYALTVHPFKIDMKKTYNILTISCVLFICRAS